MFPVILDLPFLGIDKLFGGSKIRSRTAGRFVETFN
jgi:hypothetical protein